MDLISTLMLIGIFLVLVMLLIFTGISSSATVRAMAKV